MIGFDLDIGTICLWERHLAAIGLSNTALFAARCRSHKKQTPNLG